MSFIEYTEIPPTRKKILRWTERSYSKDNDWISAGHERQSLSVKSAQKVSTYLYMHLQTSPKRSFLDLCITNPIYNTWKIHMFHSNTSNLHKLQPPEDIQRPSLFINVRTYISDRERPTCTCSFLDECILHISGILTSLNTWVRGW